MTSAEPHLYRRILVATGGAPHSEKAVERALALATHFGATLDVVAVIPTAGNALLNMAAGLPGSEVLEAQRVQNDRDVREAHLQQVSALARQQGLTVHAHLIQAAKPADAILSVARDTGADLIVLGRRHTTALSAAMAGSTGDAVSHAAPIDVLIAR
ncbi:universal stress protein [Deinococcus maricopensis]|uniref:Universal stress protein n=1 Tax=Deinococcus maricopensis (strain DSM 21211 / LMG 22137 / NRRL B-23946 / LB-34) TaxID=709986 RepID=E8U439_DEIML|nr:universal stress protein [Deinococcus maricopensis]ADV65876.1 UspA domain-containing protein [Deinococcus maricopensis DSM 21211]